MKKISLIVMAFVLVLFVFADANAQYNKPDKELTKAEADTLINNYKSNIETLGSQIKALDDDIAKLKNDIEEAKKSLKECQDAIYAEIGATEQDVNNFRQKLGVIEGKIRSMQGLSNDQLADKGDEIDELENQLNELRRIKISIMREFFDRIIADAKDIRNLRQRQKDAASKRSYTVGTWAENRDCLWNIAGKIDIYGDPSLWPKIWQANTDMIRNPDIIHPGQVLSLPEKGPKTTDEQKAERRYWRKKRTMMEEQINEEKGQ